MKNRQRLDAALVKGGFFDSCKGAQRAIMAGQVLIAGQPTGKAGTLIAPDAPITIKEKEKYVGRGGLKLEAALTHFRVQPKDRICLDIGASTGGFTDCLLQRGATRVYAVDVGHGQLHWKLRNHPQVIVQEKINARYLSRTEVPEPISLMVVDVSFISLVLILPAAFALLSPKADVIVLIKPQFELPPSEVGRGGVVRDVVMRRKAADGIRDFVVASGWHWLGDMDSPVPGREGNVEFLAHLQP